MLLPKELGDEALAVASNAQIAARIGAPKELQDAIRSRNSGGKSASECAGFCTTPASAAPSAGSLVAPEVVWLQRFAKSA